jgi:hypothetical protein
MANGMTRHDLRLFGEQLEEIVQVCSPAEFESRMYAVIGVPYQRCVRRTKRVVPFRF